jgi:hypothetical protein
VKLIKPPQERLLDLENLGDLADSEQRHVLIVQGQRSHSYLPAELSGDEPAT